MSAGRESKRYRKRQERKRKLRDSYTPYEPRVACRRYSKRDEGFYSD